MSEIIAKIMNGNAEATSPSLAASLILTNNLINHQETIRQSQEADRQANTTEAIEYAENATSSTITATGLATTATNNAINATQAAITATGNAENAAQAALDAAGDATASNNYSLQSKRWAIGTVVPEDAEDNAKYYSEVAQNAAQTASEYSSIVYPNLSIDITTGMLSSLGGENISFSLDANGNLISEVTV
jgi:hypothetical protein